MNTVKTWKEAIAEALFLLMQNSSSTQLSFGFNTQQILDTIRQYNLRDVTSACTPQNTISRILTTSTHDETRMFVRAPDGNGYLLSNQSFNVMYNATNHVAASPQLAVSASSAPDSN